MADIETRLLRYFVTLAEEQHFSRAALRLEISPPTLTHQIKKLERELGARLLDRKGNTHVLLTEAGVRFLERARDLLRQIEETKIVAQQAGRGEIGRIEVGFMPSATCTGLLHRVLGEFQRANPTIEINMHRMVPMDQITAIMRTDLDVGFTRGPYRYPVGIEGFEVHRQTMILALPEDHPLAQRKKLEPAMLREEQFINTGPELDVGFWGHTEAVARIGSFTPRVVKRDHDLITILTYVSMGLGVAVVPESLSTMRFPNVVYRDLAMSPLPTTSIVFAYRRNESSPSTGLLIRHMRRHALTLKAAE